MVEEFDVGQIFEDSVYQRPTYWVRYQGVDYTAMVSNGEVQWFQPTPQNNLKGEHLEAVESMVYEQMNRNGQ